MDKHNAEMIDDRVVTFRRLVDAPRELVWRAWTTAEYVEQWWGPPGCENTDCEIDLRVGGDFHLQMLVPNGESYPCSGRIVECDPPSRLAIAGDDEAEHPCGAGLPPGALVILTLDDQDGKTALTLETRFSTAAAMHAANASGYSTNWPPCIDRLAEFVASHRTKAS